MASVELPQGLTFFITNINCFFSCKRVGVYPIIVYKEVDILYIVIFLNVSTHNKHLYIALKE